MGVEFGEPPLLENTGDILWWQEAWKQLNDMKGHGRSLGLEGGFQGNAEETIGGNQLQVQGIPGNPPTASEPVGLWVWPCGHTRLVLLMRRLRWRLGPMKSD